jgi:hypothetical protein
MKEFANRMPVGPYNARNSLKGNTILLRSRYVVKFSSSGSKGGSYRKIKVEDKTWGVLSTVQNQRLLTVIRNRGNVMISKTYQKRIGNERRAFRRVSGLLIALHVLENE